MKRVAIAVLLLALFGMAGCGEEEQSNGLVPGVRAFLDGWAAPLGEDRVEPTGFPLRVRRMKDEAEMIFVRGGSFQIGAVPQDKDALDDEKPRHAVVVGGFYMDVNEVTRGQFRRYVEETGYVTDPERIGDGYVVGVPPEPRGWSGANWRSPTHGGKQPKNADTHPITLVSWNDAMAYARWASAELPSEEQFEFVLRGGGAGRIYPWGDVLVADPAEANLPGEELHRTYPGWKGSWVKGHEDEFPWTAPVRSFSPNSFGLYDVSGNVSEWCRDAFAMYDEDPDEAYGPGRVPSRVMRGSSFWEHRGRIRCSWRTQAKASFGRSWWGFRCVKRLPEPSK